MGGVEKIGKVPKIGDKPEEKKPEVKVEKSIEPEAKVPEPEVKVEKTVKKTDKKPRTRDIKVKLVKVKNIHRKDINLSNGCIKKGETGMATKTELSTLRKYLEAVK